MRVVLEGASALKESNEADTMNKLVLSLGQDPVYAVPKGKIWTLKHIGLGSTVHQATRSNELVTLLHNTGHSIAYKDILKIDTSLAQKTIESLSEENSGVFPPNFEAGRFTHFSIDNIDSHILVLIT